MKSDKKVCKTNQSIKTLEKRPKTSVENGEKDNNANNANLNK